MKRKLPTPEFIAECRKTMLLFDGAEAIDDPEDFLNDIPGYLEAIISLYDEVQRLKRVDLDSARGQRFDRQT
jgi:hypothetical protein